MQPLTASPFVTELAIGYMTLFSIINPFGVAFVFLTMTRDLPEPARARVVCMSRQSDALLAFSEHGI